MVMKSKKAVAKAAKKAVKPAVKKAAPKKAPPKKLVASKSKPAPAKKPAAKKAAKPVSKVQAAASKLKSLFATKKKPQVAAKPVAKKPAAPTKPASKPVSKPLAKSIAPAAKASASKPSFSSRLETPKGLVSEPQIRRMSDKDYMNDAQLDFFRHRLLQMREEVLAREVDVKERLHQREVFADPADRATAEEEHWLDLRLRERESLLLRKIDEALRRIAEKEFGYCEKTGDPIGIPRLLARPTATVCVDIKGQDERVEAQFRDR